MLDRLLGLTSRTFALSIPLLPDRVRQEITIAYLLFRVADTLEDEPSWPPAERVRALRSLAGFLGRRERMADVEKEIMRGPVSDSGYADLLHNFDAVNEALVELPEESQKVIVDHLQRTIDGMCSYLLLEDGVTTVDEVREYCYYVAGIVGELCTALFVLNAPSLRERERDLIDLAPSFGEALQLVNILRDERADATEGRRYIPVDLDRAQLMKIAGDDLQRATEYVGLLEDHGAGSGIVAFNGLNLALAFATLARVRREGPGAKLARDEVAEIHDAVVNAAERGEPVVDLLRRAGAPEAQAVADSHSNL